MFLDKNNDDKKFKCCITPIKMMEFSLTFPKLSEIKPVSWLIPCPSLYNKQY